MKKMIKKKLIWLLLLITLASAAATGWWWNKHHAAHSVGGAVLAGANIDFSVNECVARLYEDKPALAVMFSDTVQNEQALDKLIEVVDLGDVKSTDAKKSAQSVDAAASAASSSAFTSTSTAANIVKGGWVTADNPHVLIFPFVKAGHQYQITLNSALAALSGKKLDKAHQCKVVSDEMAPAYFFASKGTVLPAGLNGGLPVVTVNTPEVDVEFLRVTPEKTPKFINLVLGKRNVTDHTESNSNEENSAGEDEGDSYYSGDNSNKLKGQTYGWQLNQLQGIAESVYTNRFLTSDVHNSRKVSFLPVEKIAELKEPGIYIAVMRRPGFFDNDYQVTYFYVSDIGLHARRQIKQTDVFTTSLSSGKAQSGIELEVLGATGKVLLRGKTDGDGHGILPGLPDGARLLLAKRGKETSLIALQEPGLDLAEFDIGGHLPRDVKLFAWSGRDLYRPGEKFTVSLLARSADGAMLPPLPIKTQLKKPSGEVVNAALWQPNPKIPGYLQQDIALPADAATGKWSVEFRADPSAKRADAIYSFQVEEFLPERMKLTLKSEEKADTKSAAKSEAKSGAKSESKSDLKPLTNNDEFKIEAQGDYLYGAPAAGNRLLGSVAQERARNPLPKEWPGFIFGDFHDDDAKNRAELPENALDQNGKATLNVPFKTDATSPMRIRASLSLLESGGRPVVRSIERIWWPADAMLALRPAFDGDVTREGSMAEFELIRVTPSGKFAGVKQAPFRLVREDRQYYWRYDAQRGWHSGYSESEETMHSGVVELNQRAKLTVPVSWGTYRLEVTDPHTKLVLRYRFYAGWNAQDAESMGNRPDRVRLELEGAPVKPGNDVKLKIVPPHDGEALILVEADKVLWSKRLSVSTAGTSVTIPIDKEWNRSDMYISTVVFRPGSQGDRVTPARAVGMTWLPLARESRKLKVSLSAPTQVVPEKRMLAKIKVEGLAINTNAKADAKADKKTETNLAGKTAIVTLSAVDAGILSITHFKTPDPFDFFFGKHRFGPELTDIYGKLIERMDGAPGKLKWGGDAGKRDTQSMPKKVKLIDIFSGPVQLNAQGEATIALDIPDFNGTLRLMAVASTADAYGNAEREVTVAAPIVAELSMPRFIGPGDNSTLALDVTNMMTSEQNIAIKLGADKLLRIAQGERTIKLAPRQRNILRFNVEATEPFGLSQLTLQIKTDGAKPIVIQRQFALQLQPPVPREQQTRRIRLEPGASHRVDATMLEPLYPGSATLSVTLSNQAPFNIRSLVKGLLDYPYGCLEQTTSAAYPYVFIDEASAKAVGLEPRTREQRAKFIEGAISRIAGLQGANGAFRLWRGNEGPYENWLTAYVAGFLMDARDAGFTVPEDLSKRAQQWMIERLNSAANQFAPLPAAVKSASNGYYDWRDADLLRNSHQRFAELAHIGYMLAREQKASLASLRLLHDQYRTRARSPLPLVHLGIALALMGDAKRSQVAINEAISKPYGINADSEWDWLGDYGTPIRDQALSYALLMRHKINHPQREALLVNLATRLNRPRAYFSTQERTALFLAARAAGGSNQAWEATIKTADGAINLTSKSNEVRSFDPAVALKNLTIENRGRDALWIEVETSGFPIKPPAPNNDKIALERHWFTPDGHPWKGGALKVGDMLLVRVSAKAGQAIEDGLIVDPIPAGLEVENLNLSQGPQAGEFKVDGINLAEAMGDSRIKHTEYRDDRFVAAVKLDAKTLNLFYLLRVVTPGRFHVPGSYAEDMYRPEIRSQSAPSEPVTVVDPNSNSK